LDIVHRGQGITSPRAIFKSGFCARGTLSGAVSFAAALASARFGDCFTVGASGAGFFSAASIFGDFSPGGLAAGKLTHVPATVTASLQVTVAGTRLTAVGLR
jgi:hypothetical protein